MTLTMAAGAHPALAQSEEPTRDLLRFDNGDSLHGKYLGLEGDEIHWRHSEAREVIKLKTGKLRRISLNGGRPAEPVRSSSFVVLTDGDRIPGSIVSLDTDTLVMESEVAGTLSIPRTNLSRISPVPHGGAVHYVGPFAADEWSVILPEEEKAEDPPAPEGQEKVDAEDAKSDEEEGDEAQEEEEEPAPWTFAGGAYYSNGLRPIAVDTKAPDRARIRFTIAWRNRLNAAIAFHATLKQPEPPEPEENAGDGEKKEPARKAREATGTASFAYTYGHSYVLTIYSNYAQIYRCSFNENGEADIDRLSNSSANLRLDEIGEAEFELRCDREAGTIALFANGRFVSQWEDRQGYAGSGGHLAFTSQTGSSRIRVSDVLVTSWNGMIDSAQSMEVDDRDIILLANGTDRFSGEVLSLKDGKFLVKGTYAEMTVPLGEVEEVRFARAKRASRDDEANSLQTVRLLFQPNGRLTVAPREASSTRMKANHPAVGDIELDLRYTGLMEFSFGESVLDSWDDDY